MNDRVRELVNVAEHLVEQLAKTRYEFSLSEIEQKIETEYHIHKLLVSEKTGKRHLNPEFQLVMTLAREFARERGLTWGSSRG